MFIICWRCCWFLWSSANVQNQCVMWEKMEQLEQSTALAHHSHFQWKAEVTSLASLHLVCVFCLICAQRLSPVLLNLPFCFFNGLDFAAVLSHQSKPSPHLHHWHHSSQAGGDNQAWTKLRKQMTHFVVYAYEPLLIGVTLGSSPCFRCLTQQRGGKHCLHGKLIFMFRMWNSSPPFTNVFKNLLGGACQHKLECLTIS